MKTLFISEITLRSVQHGKDGLATHVSEEITWTENDNGTPKDIVTRLREEGETVEVIEARGSTVDEAGEIEERVVLHLAYGQTFRPVTVERFTAEIAKNYNLDSNSALV